MLLQADVYVYEYKQKVQGFIGLDNKYIEGIFISDKMQAHSLDETTNEKYYIMLWEL